MKRLLQPVRAALAKQLMMKHGLKQVEAAKLLGASHPAISLYGRKRTKVRRLIEEMADFPANESPNQQRFQIHQVCRVKQLLAWGRDENPKPV
ncbi:MAG: hypothetical protein ACUVTE_02420 [Candidatus Bathycorpusculaceae bacterium]